MKTLDNAKANLRDVEEGLASLQAKYDECVAKKEELKDKCDLCEARLTRAEKVIVKGISSLLYIVYTNWKIIPLLIVADF